MTTVTYWIRTDDRGVPAPGRRLARRLTPIGIRTVSFRRGRLETAICDLKSAGPVGALLKKTEKRVRQPDAGKFRFEEYFRRLKSGVGINGINRVR